MHRREEEEEDAGCPVPGSLQVLGMRITKSFGKVRFPVLDALVTTYIRRGIVIGFRFLRRDEDCMSPRAVNVMFTLTTCLRPGTFLQLGESGRVLLSYESLHGTEGVVVGCSRTMLHISKNSSCFIFWVPNPALAPEGISFLGFHTKKAHAVMPQERTVPCEYTTVVNVPACAQLSSSSSTDSSCCRESESDDEDAETSHHKLKEPNPFYMVFGGSTRAISGTWLHAWQQFKYAATGQKWRYCSLYRYNEAIDDLARSLFVCPVPGQLIPLAYRPCAEGEEDGGEEDCGVTSLPAELAVLVTAPIPPRTNVWIVPNCSNETNVREEALWLWTSPCRDWVPAGTTIAYGRLAHGYQPCVSIGTIVKSGLWPTRGFFIRAFTLYGMAREVSSSTTSCADAAYAITAVYTCEQGCELPRSLVLGESIASRPWPCDAAVLPVENCRARRIPRDWLVEKVKLLHARPVRWICQPLPIFRRLEPGRDCTAVETAPIASFMSGSC